MTNKLFNFLSILNIHKDLIDKIDLIDVGNGFVSLYDSNLVPSASFHYERKSKKRPWNTSNTGSKFAVKDGIFLRVNYGIRGRRY